MTSSLPQALRQHLPTGQLKRAFVVDRSSIDEEARTVKLALQRAKQRGKKSKRELIGVSAALQEVLDRMKAMEGYSPMGAVFRAPRTNNAYSEPGFKAMWQRLMQKALDEKIIEERFTFHDLRGHYTTYFKLKFCELPELHADPKTTTGVYERSREVRRKSL